MKKFIIPIALVAALGIGGGVTAVMLNRTNSASANTGDTVVPADIEVKSGNYYLNGDKESGLWIEVTPEYLSLKGDDLDNDLTKATAKKHEDVFGEPITEEGLEIAFNDNKTLYCDNKVYAPRFVDLESTPYVLCVSRYNDETDPYKLMDSDAGFAYNGKDTITLDLFGDFILAD